VKRAAGPFEILEILGEGSFGTVCVARVSTDPLRRKVALKILKGAYATNDKILNRTRDEARLLSRINHPNIVRVERLMEVGGRPVVVMEHVQGVSLDQLLLRFKDGLPAAIALEMTRQTCLALHVAYAEALGDDGRPMRVIHRDIKPSNILLSIHGEVKVVDFGIAKGEFEGREAKTESVVMGSRPYMAPERLDGISDNPSVDVYSAGMSLFELLTGRTMSLSINPVSHDQAMNRQLAYVQIQGMTQAAVEDARNLIRRMCAYTRDYRPTAVECARDVEQLMYAIDARYRIGLEEFARTTVLPIYESRPRITPEDALGDGHEDEFLRDITGALTGPITSREGDFRYAPYIFVAGLAFLVVLSMVLAGAKFASELSDRGPNDGTVRVKIWIPSDAQAQVGPAFLAAPSGARVPPGRTAMEIKFDDGRQVGCVFDAKEDLSVRYVWDDGRHALSIDDGPAEPCNGEPNPG
jgi:serine/threonine protein kinase